jgi:hypothetical protein
MKLVPHWHRDTRMTTDLRRALITVAPPTLLVAAWRWRYEIALLAGLAAILVIGITSVGVLPTIAVVTVITVAVLAWPPTRQSWRGPRLGNSCSAALGASSQRTEYASAAPKQ